jgi:hypothetical protein
VSGGFKDALDRFAEYRDTARPSIDKATVAVTETYCRRTLGLRKDDPLMYRGLQLTCIGSKRWREENWDWRRPTPPHFARATMNRDSRCFHQSGVTR